jgi:hypothetical protein
MPHPYNFCQLSHLAGPIFCMPHPYYSTRLVLFIIECHAAANCPIWLAQFIECHTTPIIPFGRRICECGAANSSFCYDTSFYIQPMRPFGLHKIFLAGIQLNHIINKTTSFLWILMTTSICHHTLFSEGRLNWSWYIPTDCTNERFNCWPAHILPHPLKAHGIPDPED